jgi:hypothetical protein
MREGEEQPRREPRLSFPVLASRCGAADTGIVQQELADRLGKPQSFVAKIERGERWVDMIEFLAIAKAIGRDPLRLLSRTWNPR